MKKCCILALLLFLAVIAPSYARSGVFVRGGSSLEKIMIFVIAHYGDSRQEGLENNILDLLNDRIQNGDLSHLECLNSRVRTLNIADNSRQDKRLLQALGVSEQELPGVFVVGLNAEGQPSKLLWKAKLVSASQQAEELSCFLKNNFIQGSKQVRGQGEALISDAALVETPEYLEYRTGSVLKLQVRGCAQAQAKAIIGDITTIALQEVRPGEYVGSYQLRPQDWGAQLVRVELTAAEGRQEIRQLGTVYFKSQDRRNYDSERNRGRLSGISQVGATDWMFRGYAAPKANVKLHVVFDKELLFVKNTEEYEFLGQCDEYGRYQIVGHMQSDVDGEIGKITMTVIPPTGSSYIFVQELKFISDWHYNVRY